MDLPSSQATLMTACPGLGPRWCPQHIAIAHSELLSSVMVRTSTFLSVSPELSNDHKELDFGAQYTAYILDPSSFRLPSPDLPVDFSTDPLAKL